MTTVSDVTTQPASGLNHIDALLDNGPGWNWLTPSRTTLYYTFTLAPENPGAAGQVSGPSTAFNAAQQAAVQTALSYLTQITGISFSATSNGNDADLHFAAIDIVGASTSGLCSWSWGYSSNGSNITSYTADAWVYLDNVQWAADNNNPGVGSAGYETLLHELAHAIGLKHPFDDGVTLPAAKDNTDFTLMSYTHVGGVKSVYSPYDIAALMWLYGGDGLGGQLGQGTQGRWLMGSEAADTLTGGSGDDTFEGKAGNDTINGGAGTDSARFSGNRSLYTITPFSGGATISGPDGTDTLNAVEKAVFADQTVTLSTTSPPPGGGTGGSGNHAPTGTVLIAGALLQGELLTAVSTLADADGLGKLAYRWQSSPDGVAWTDVANGNGTTLTPGEALVGARLRVTVSYTDGGGALESATSSVSVPVANLNDSPTGAVFINGTAREDAALTVTQTLADADGMGPLSWQWQASFDGSNWIDISGATGTGFTPGDKQVGQRLRVIASWTDGHGSSETMPSVATAAVANVNDVPTGSVTVSGDAEQGQALRATNTLADADGLGSISYEWQASANGSTWSAVAGANGSSFTPALAQVGQFVRAVARFTDGRGTAEAVPSAATVTVLGRVTGTVGADTLTGSAWADRIDALDGNDRLQGGGGNDRLDGGAGLDRALFSRARSDYTVSGDGSSSGLTVKALTGDEGSDSLAGIERLQFSDQSLAFDLDGAAGSTARILGAVFGREAVANKGFAGIGLSLLDGGMDLNALMQLALDARLGSGFAPAAEVTLLFQNLVGSGPSAADLGFWTAALQAGTYTPVSLAWMAANLELNAQNIDLVGLATSGLAYGP